MVTGVINMHTQNEKAIKYSIVIPTYNHFEDCLKPCVDSILATVDAAEVEIIVVANGCVDGTKDYLQQHAKTVKTIWLDEPAGYTKATNLGIKEANGNYIILLNNDVVIYNTGIKNHWINILEEPFKIDEKVGITGAAKNYHAGTDHDFLLFFCVMVSKRLINEIGFLDEIFNPGYGEDIDYCYRARNAGYKVLQVPNDVTYTKMRGYKDHTIFFPLYHPGSTTVHSVPGWLDIVARNEQILNERYCKPATKIKYSVIIPTLNHLDDCLRPCIESVIKFTDLTNVEVIIVANGCVDGTRKYVEDLGHPFKLIWIDKPSGFCIPVNRGIEASRGDYIVLLNNDTVIMQDRWLDVLNEPFVDDNVGISGPVRSSFFINDFENYEFVAFSCAMISRKVVNAIGKLDESLYAFADDIDYCCRATMAGFSIRPLDELFSFYHAGAKTFAPHGERDYYIHSNLHTMYQRYLHSNLPTIKKHDRYLHRYFDNLPKEQIATKFAEVSQDLPQDNLLQVAFDYKTSCSIHKTGFHHGLFVGIEYKNNLVKDSEKCIDHSLNSISNWVRSKGGFFPYGQMYHGGYLVQQNGLELSLFLHFIKELQIENYLEIGVADGGFTRNLCDIINVRNVYQMDMGLEFHINPHFHSYRQNLYNYRNSGKTRIYRGDSHDKNASKWLSEQRVKFDFIFIDGDHSYSGILQDTHLAMLYIKSNGYIAYHDHACVADVGKFIEELKQGKLTNLQYVAEFVDPSAPMGISLFQYKI